MKDNDYKRKTDWKTMIIKKGQVDSKLYIIMERQIERQWLQKKDRLKDNDYKERTDWKTMIYDHGKTNWKTMSTKERQIERQIERQLYMIMERHIERHWLQKKDRLKDNDYKVKTDWKTTITK